MRVYVVVEGLSEELFLKSVVTPHLALHGVWLYPLRVLLPGGGRGGGRSWGPWNRQLRGLLMQERGNNVRVTTMLDLYAMPKDTPGWTETEPARGADRARNMSSAIAESIADWRFIPYIQLHEFETFLFCDLRKLSDTAPDIVKQPEFNGLMKQTLGVPAEQIDGDPMTAPSKRIASCTAGFRKAIHGVQAAAAIGLDRLRPCCPAFNAWLENLESLGSPA